MRPLPGRQSTKKPAGPCTLSANSLVGQASACQSERNSTWTSRRTVLLCQQHAQEGFGGPVEFLFAAVHDAQGARQARRVQLYRYEAALFPQGNDNTGAFPNFNAINTGTPFDVAGTVFSPQNNVDRTRQRTRIRTRLGADIDMGEGFTMGARLATGENSSPVTTNQSLGAPG